MHPTFGCALNAVAKGRETLNLDAFAISYALSIKYLYVVRVIP